MILRGSGTIDYCELCAFDYCNSLVDGTKTFLSELDFQTHYNKTIGQWKNIRKIDS